MKFYLVAAFFFFLHVLTFLSGQASGQCPSANSDKLYNRDQMLNQLIAILNTSVPDYSPKNPGFYVTDEGKAGGFFVYDLSDPSNNDTASTKHCINFIDNHIYHFAPTQDQYSASHIVILENGKLKVFKSINCSYSEDQLADVISYLEPHLKDSKHEDALLLRLKHYRKYGSYIPSDYPTYFCKNGAGTNTNKYSVDPNELFLEKNVLLEFANALNRAIPGYTKYFNNGFFNDRGKAVGFFVYDLSDPRNKQTSDEEQVYFLKNHVYHFAPIDLPWSFSFIAVLGEHDLKIFRLLNCKGKGDKLKDVISYLNKNFKDERSKTEIVSRVKNYRKFGVYASFDGLSRPECEQAK